MPVIPLLFFVSFSSGNRLSSLLVASRPKRIEVALSKGIPSLIDTNFGSTPGFSSTNLQILNSSFDSRPGLPLFLDRGIDIVDLTIFMLSNGFFHAQYYIAECIVL